MKYCKFLLIRCFLSFSVLLFSCCQVISEHLNASPAASFTYSPVSPSPGQAVQFVDTSTGTPNSWQWDFGDGATSTLQSPIHSYTATGPYAVTLVIGNGSTSESANQTVTVASTSAIIPADRRIDWTYCGIPGGIPNRTTIYTTLSAGATTAQINAAIANCPSGQVVYLNAGTYNNIGEIKHKSNVTLRGAGPGRTIINSTSTGYGITSDDCWTYTNVSMTGGYSKGSTSVIVASSSGFQVGNTIIFEQNDDTRIVMATGGPGRYFKTHAIVTGLNGNTISFTPPLPYTLSATLSPTAGYWTYGNFPIISAGIESLTINAVNSMNAMVKYYGSHRCWIKNVELNGLDNMGVWVPGAVQFEMRRCYIHDARNAPANTDGYGVYL